MDAYDGMIHQIPMRAPSIFIVTYQNVLTEISGLC
jgi:hypothetical protein